jgi:prepilin-type N-terminal cleavage/methylation domain-containing protein
MSLRSRDEEGFTLVEMLMVLVIIGILIAIVVVSFVYAKTRAVEVADRMNLRTLRAAIARYRDESPTSDSPAALDDLYPHYVSNKSGLFEPEKHLQYVYDPTTGAVSDPLHPDR